MTDIEKLEAVTRKIDRSRGFVEGLTLQLHNALIKVRKLEKKVIELEVENKRLRELHKDTLHETA